MAPSSTILHLDQPRSGGHLLQRMLSEQPKRHFLNHPFSQARGKQVQWLTSGNAKDGMSEELRAYFDVEVEQGLDAWEKAVRDTEDNGEVLMIQDHCFNSAPPETVLTVLDLIAKGEAGPDEGMNVTQASEWLLLQPGIVPLFTIREPRLAVLSAYRALERLGLPRGSGQANFSVSTNPIWIRLLYDWYVAHGVEPVIVDCDDVQCSETSDFMQRLCVRLDLDPERVRFQWPKISGEEREKIHPMLYASQNTLLESEGVDPALAARNRDLTKEAEGWKDEFGEDVGLVREMVELASVHCAWLMERTFK